MKTHKTLHGIFLCLALIAFSGLSPAQMRSGKLGVGVSGSLYLFNPNLSDGLYKGGGGVSLSYSVMEHLGIRASLGTGQLGWKDALGGSNTTTLMSGNLYLSYDMIPHGTFNPFLYAGAGGIYFDPRSDNGPDLGSGITKIDINYYGGIGFDIFFSEFVSVTLSGEYALANTNKLDMMKSGTANENYSRVNLEFRYYFFDQDYVTKLIQALQDRYKKR
ncbi:MAG TPA: outer membrane beta-barrel protein [Bacteroidota bacterium]